MSRRGPFLQPASGAALLAIDWLFFGLEWSLGPVSLAAASFAAFLSCYVIVSRVQEAAGEARRLARAKAVFAAVLAGLPFPIAGTALGALVLILSGLSSKPRLPPGSPPS